MENKEKKSQSDDPEKRGEAAIEADKKLNKQDKPEDKKNKEEEKDAENWRNEG